MHSPVRVESAGIDEYGPTYAPHWPAFAIGISATAWYLTMAPAVVNGDGLGYLKAAVLGGRYPAHALYIPLLRGLRLLFRCGPRPADALGVARAFSAASAGLAVALLGTATTRLTRSAQAGAIAAFGFAVSSGFLTSASDVESYAPAVASLCLALDGVARARESRILGLAFASLGTALALLFHVENLLFVPVVVLSLPRSRRLLATALIGIVSLPLFIGVCDFGRGLVPATTHGFRYPLSIATPGIALYGAAKALVFSPYPFEAPRMEVVRDSAVGIVVLFTLVVLFVRGRGAVPLPRRAVAAWTSGYATVGMVFFPSDAERWLFLLPLLWLAAASRLRWVRLLPIVMVLLIADLLLVLPRTHDDHVARRAAAAARHLAPGDLVLSPGHGWDEYIGFERGPDIENVPIAYFAGQLGTRARLAEEIARRIAVARSRGRRICTARFREDSEPLGWKELRAFGINPRNVKALLPLHQEQLLGDGISCLTFP
jgi:hypothetical protein